MHFIHRSQLNAGRLLKNQKAENMESFSVATHDVKIGENVDLSVDCGLKSIESRFYKRDYIINLESRRSMDSQTFTALTKVKLY